MCKAICGANCAECTYKNNCNGCVETNGCPFGKQCFVAKYILTDGMENYKLFKQKLINEINELRVDGMEEVSELYPLVGEFVNLEYPMPNGKTVKFLNNDEIYLGAQVKNLFDDSGSSCYGVVAREGFIIICEYGEGGSSPELIMYKRR